MTFMLSMFQVLVFQGATKDNNGTAKWTNGLPEALSPSKQAALYLANGLLISLQLELVLVVTCCRT